MKRVTINFVPITQKDGAVDPEVILQKYKELGADIAYDRRNGIYCINPTYDIECYKNYLTYLNNHYDEWQSYGYFDLGLVPVLIAPSFMAEALNAELSMLVKNWKMKLYTLRATSFLYPKYIGASKDVWITREDMASLCGTTPEQASLSKFLAKIS